MAPKLVVTLSFRHALLPATLCRIRFRRSLVGPKIEGVFQEMILVVHFLSFPQVAPCLCITCVLSVL